MEKELEDSQSIVLSLRSNQQAENDRLKKTVRDTEAPKDAINARLKKEIERLNQIQVRDEETIRDISRLNTEYRERDEVIKVVASMEGEDAL